MSKAITSINSIEEAKELINLAILAGQLLIQNGGEIYRAEDTVRLMCESRENLHDIDVFAINNAIFVSCEFNGETLTVFKNVDSQQIHLDRIQAINAFSRKFVRENISLENAKQTLVEIGHIPFCGIRKKMFYIGLCVASFSVLFGGNIYDFIVSFFIGIALVIFQTEVEKKNFPMFAEIFFASFIVSFLALIASSAFDLINMDKIIIGSIMPLVPGMTITTALRDIISGDYVSGVVGLVKGIFTAFAIALAVGVVLNFRLFLGGF